MANNPDTQIEIEKLAEGTAQLDLGANQSSISD
jgi:hypothetical protein